jgi:non-specific serine/threonine protein kinase
MTGPTGVSASLSTFIGRKSEMARMRRLMPRTRLLTLTGPGGCGKTRLAMEYARQQQSRFRDGVIVVELAAVHETNMVADALARAIGIRPESDAELSMLGRRLRDRHLLLVVDNCEHLVAAVAETVASLLRECAEISVLATSREPLNVEGETLWRVPPLSLPEPVDSPHLMLSADAVRFFIDRARGARPEYVIDGSNVAVVAAICHRLDGMPLSIELAAARVGVLSPAEILPRLDDRFRLLTAGRRDADARHQTLQATIDWSYQLMDADERRMLNRLAVFAGSFCAEAAEEVCALPPVGRAEVLDALGQLAGKSMVQAEQGPSGETRYRLLESIREYAGARLADSDELPALRDRHLAYYGRLAAEAFEKRVRRGAMPEHLRLWSEIADVRAALEWSRRDPEAELGLLSHLYLIWMMFAPAEGFRRLSEALGRPPEGDVTLVQARAVWAWSALGGRSGLSPETLLDLKRMALLARRSGDQFLIAKEHLGRGYMAERKERDLEMARHHLRLAVTAHEELDAGPDLAMALCSLGSVEMQLGNLDAARPYIQRGLELALAVDDQYGAVGAHFTLGWLELECAALEPARAGFQAALKLAPDGDLLSVAFQVEGIACTEAAGNPEHALTLFAAADGMRAEVAMPLGLPWSERVEKGIAEARTALSAGSAAAAWERGHGLKAAQVVGELVPVVADGGRRKRGSSSLSRRESEIAELVAAGLTNRAIAERLFLAERTVESHVDHILTKLDFGSRTLLAAWVTEQRMGGRATEPGD